MIEYLCYRWLVSAGMVQRFRLIDCTEVMLQLMVKEVQCYLL